MFNFDVIVLGLQMIQAEPSFEVFGSFKTSLAQAWLVYYLGVLDSFTKSVSINETSLHKWALVY